MTDTPQPLWDDTRIATLAEYAAANWDAADIGDLLRRLRDDYEAELAAARARIVELEAEHGEWEPVEDGPWQADEDCDFGITIVAHAQGMTFSALGTDFEINFGDCRLCSRLEATP